MEGRGLIRNATGNVWCNWCGNTGWVTLLGTVRTLGHDYTRGVTACKWCELGTKRYLHATDKFYGTRLETDFGESDVDLVGPERSAPHGDRREQFTRLAQLARRVGASLPHEVDDADAQNERQRQATAELAKVGGAS